MAVEESMVESALSNSRLISDDIWSGVAGEVARCYRKSDAVRIDSSGAQWNESRITYELIRIHDRPRGIEVVASGSDAGLSGLILLAGYFPKRRMADLRAHSDRATLVVLDSRHTAEYASKVYARLATVVLLRDGWVDLPGFGAVFVDMIAEYESVVADVVVAPLGEARRIVDGYKDRLADYVSNGSLPQKLGAVVITGKPTANHSLLAMLDALTMSYPLLVWASELDPSKVGMIQIHLTWSGAGLPNSKRRIAEAYHVMDVMLERLGKARDLNFDEAAEEPRLHKDHQRAKNDSTFPQRYLSCQEWLCRSLGLLPTRVSIKLPSLAADASHLLTVKQPPGIECVRVGCANSGWKGRSEPEVAASESSVVLRERSSSAIADWQVARSMGFVRISAAALLSAFICGYLRRNSIYDGGADNEDTRRQIAIGVGAILLFLPGYMLEAVRSEVGIFASRLSKLLHTLCVVAPGVTLGAAFIVGAFRPEQTRWWNTSLAISSCLNFGVFVLLTLIVVTPRFSDGSAVVQIRRRVCEAGTKSWKGRDLRTRQDQAHFHVVSGRLALNLFAGTTGAWTNVVVFGSNMSISKIPPEWSLISKLTVGFSAGFILLNLATAMFAWSVGFIRQMSTRLTPR